MTIAPLQNIMKQPTRINPKNKSQKSALDQRWERLYKTEEKKYKKYIETTKISNLATLAQELSKDVPTTQVFTDY